jgi:4-hydroxybenzoate polyprenyltransferase
MIYSDATRKGRFYSKLSRPQNILYSGLIAGLTSYYQNGLFWSSICCYLLILFLYAVVTSYNNITDINTDRINNRTDNPLLAGRPKSVEMKIFISSCLFLIMLIQIPLKQPSTLIISAIYLVIALSYSHRTINIKSRSWLGVIVLTLCYGTLPFLIGTTQGNNFKLQAAIGLSLFQVPLLFPVLLSKDYKDIKGDKITKKHTPVVVHGKIIVRQTAISLALFSSVIYLGLVLKYGLNLTLALFFIALYLSLCFYLHYKQGKVNLHLRQLLTLILLIMSLTLIPVL